QARAPMDKYQGTDYRKEAMDFWAQARADFATAATWMDAGIYYASVFFSQQAAEKALKAAAAGTQNRSPKGHNIIQIANSLNALVSPLDAAARTGGARTRGRRAGDLRSRARGALPGGAARGERRGRGALGPDAQLGVPGRERPRAAAGSPLVRPADGGAVRVD